MTEQQQESAAFHESRFMEALGLNPEPVIPGSVKITSQGGAPRIEFSLGFTVTPIALANAFAAAADAPPVVNEQPPVAAPPEPPTPFGDPGAQPVSPDDLPPVPPGAVVVAGAGADGPDEQPAPRPRRAAKKAPAKKAAAKRAPAKKAAPKAPGKAGA